MTAALVETTSFGGTVVQGAPTFKGRAVVGWSSGRDVKGVVASAVPDVHGSRQSVGFGDESLNQYAAGISYTHQVPFFPDSGSLGMPNVFQTTMWGVNSPPVEGVKVDEFGCGEVVLAQGSSVPSNNYVAALILSGKTLQSKTGLIAGSAAGHQSVTGLGFRPQVIMLEWWGWAQFGQVVSFVGETAQISFGAYDGTNQWSFGAKTNGWLTGGTKQSRFSQSAILTAPGEQDVQAVSLDADGFTLNFLAARPGYIAWAAFGDVNGQFACGVGTEGDTSIAPGFKADAVVFGNSGVDVLDTDKLGCSTGFGGCDSNLIQHGGWAAIGSGTPFTHVGYYNDYALPMSKITVGTPALDAQASVTAINASTVDLNWSTGGGGGLLFGWVAFRCSAAPGFDGCGGNQQQIYRWLKR